MSPGSAHNSTTSRHRGRFVVNLVANIANFSISILIGLWMVPYLIGKLGVAAYGLIPLATSVTSYLSVLTVSLNGAVGRFLTVSVEHGDNESANRIFNTSLFGSMCLVAVLIGPSLLLAGHAGSFFDIPQGYESQFTWLFYCTIAVFMLMTLTTPFGVASYSRNRFDLSNGISIAANLLRVAIVVLLFSTTAPSVLHVGTGMVAASMLTLTASIMVQRRLLPALRPRLRLFSWGKLVDLVTTGGWIVVNQIGTLLYLGIDVVVVNTVIGAESAGRYAAVLTWSGLLRSFAGVLAGVFGPTVTMLYARGDIPQLTAYARRAVKFVGLVIALPIGLVCGLSLPILRVWLGSEAEQLATLMSLMTFHLSVNLAVLPLFQVQLAANRVRVPGIITCATGVLNAVLAVMLAGPAGWGMYGVAAAGAMTLTAKNLIFTPLYVAHILGRSPATFFREMIAPIAAASVLTGLGWLTSRVIHVDTWLGLLAAGAIMSCMYAAIVYRFLLTPQERSTAARLLRLGAE